MQAPAQPHEAILQLCIPSLLLPIRVVVIILRGTETGAVVFVEPRTNLGECSVQWLLFALLQLYKISICRSIFEFFRHYVSEFGVW